jgi:DNA-binding XRE family transcriptional regulator
MARKLSGGERKTKTKTGKPVKFDKYGNRLTQSGEVDKRAITNRENGRMSPVMRDALDLGDADDNTRRIVFVTTLATLPPIDTKDAGALEARLGEYLAICREQGMKAGNQAMCLALGVEVSTLISWSNGNAPTPSLVQFAKKARSICSSFRESYMQDGKVNPVTGIFWQKNYDGLKDQQEHVITPNNVLGDRPDPVRLQQKYLDSLPDPTDD